MISVESCLPAYCSVRTSPIDQQTVGRPWNIASACEYREMRLRNAAERLEVTADNISTVSALLLSPDNPKACFIFAHGAGAGMTHAFLEAVAAGLAERDIATLRYQFPFMEIGHKSPNGPATAHATVRAAVAEAARRCPGLLLLAGGKSFGGRMTSQAQAIGSLTGVQGLAFFGFPLHPASKPSVERATHLSSVDIPMLFLQGTRDKLAAVNLLEPMVKALGARATLHPVQDADHAFHVPARSGRSDSIVLIEILDVFGAWAESLPFRLRTIQSKP
jgi:predicted alpha/beta-hydrolase family hydrolase